MAEACSQDRELKDGRANIQTLPSSLSPATLPLTEQSLHEEQTLSWVNTLQDQAHGTWNST